MPTVDPGEYKIQCVKPGGDALTSYGFTATEGHVVDLLDPATPDNIRAGGFWTAQNMCEDPGFELAQKIKAGLWRVVSRREPDVQFMGMP